MFDAHYCLAVWLFFWIEREREERQREKKDSIVPPVRSIALCPFCFFGKLQFVWFVTRIRTVVIVDLNT